MSVKQSRIPSEASPARMQALARLPVFLALDCKRAVLAGGNPAAAWKAELLSASGAHVEVYAIDLCDELLQLAANPPRGVIAINRRAWTTGDLKGAAVAIGAFEDDEAAAAFASCARAAGVPVNVIDKPAFCDFAFGAIVNRSPLVIGISTDGAAPVFAQAIRAKLEALLPNGFAGWAAAAARWRSAVKASGLSFSGRRKFWQVFTAHAVANPDHEPGPKDFDRFIAEVRGLGAAVENGSVTLVGAGPGDPELLTLRAVRALQSADVILFDDLVSREVLDFARREARKMLVGKTGFGPSCRQEDINELMVSLAKQGKRVVRLKGGDPLIFGRAAEEIAACQAASIAVDVVPGITAAQGAAARLGVPLTDRKRARRLQYVTGHAKSGALPGDLDWRSLADPTTTTAIYMPTRTLAALVDKATAEGLDPRTPALAIARATRPDQAVIAATITELPERLAQANLPGPVLVMIGRAIGEKTAARETRRRHGCA
jgi:uroporphyrin-III C-methyltransferase/precorrin-2 dehydrogenase/sirohydrochlorin ferrochelatase